MCVMLNGDITLLEPEVIGLFGCLEYTNIKAKNGSNLPRLAAIYSISFLLVMGLFAFCGLWLKINRPTLRSPQYPVDAQRWKGSRCVELLR